MKKLFTCICIILLSTIIFASQDPSGALLMQSGTIYPTANIDEFASQQISSKEIIDGYYFRIIQFKTIPDDKLKSEIIASGIILNSYLPYRAFICAIPAAFDRSNLNKLQAFSVISMDQQMKLNNKINGQDFPKHSVVEAGNADLIVHYQENILHERAQQLFESAGFRIISSRQEANTFTIRLPFEKLNELTSLPFVYYIEPISVPSTKDDTEGRSMHRSNVINENYATGRHYDGSGVSIGLADDGEIGPHIDFTGRVTQHLTGLGGNHGDMTSGICVGAGNLVQRIRGMGTGAYLHVFDIGNYPQIDSAVYNYNNWGIVITSTSYAQTCNVYDVNSQLGDKLLHENTPFNFVFSAGNAGGTDCSYGAGSLYGNITGGYKMGKNVIAVGNLENTDVLIASSSRGPASDGRVKPDICSNGGSQRSTDEGNAYQVGSGTSAACPGIAGCLSQLYQAYKLKTGAANPPGGLMKACVLNSADDLGNIGPDFQHGWGRINAFRAVTTIEDQRYFIDSISQGQTHLQNITIPANIKQVRIMLYWSDKEGNPGAAKSLVNDLNLLVTEVNGGTTYNPWVLDPTPTLAALNALPVRKVDSLNNAEQVTIDNPAAGNYSISVEGFQVPFGPQSFYIVYELNSDSIKVTYPIGGEGIEPGETEKIRWDAFDSSGTFDVDYSIDNGASWNSIITAIPPTQRYYSWNVPFVFTDQALVRVTRNGLSDVSDTNFNIMSSPINLHVTFACPDSVGLAWNAVAGVTGYDVSMLGTKYMDYVGTTTATNFTVTGTSLLNDYWFSVNALGPHGGKGYRADAIHLSPGLLNCALAIDGGIQQVLSPVSGIFPDCQNQIGFPVVVEIRNLGMSTISNFDINYSLNNGTIVTQQYTGTLSTGMSANFSFTQALNITVPGNQVLQVWISLNGDQNNYNDTTIVSFNVINGAVGSVSVLEDLESFTLCSTASDCEATVCPLGNGWINADNGIYDDIDWRVNEGLTPSTTTGPDVDHTFGSSTGNYLYLEASGTCSLKEAELISPCFNLNGITNPVLTFWYHMYGADIGELHVDVIGSNGIVKDIIPARLGNQGNQWIKDSVILSLFSGQKIAIRFRGITGSDYAGDMALDDIGVFDFPSAVTEAAASGQFIIYPNPAAGVFNYITGSYNGTFEITVQDVIGNVIYKKTCMDNELSGKIDLSEKANGIYTATICSDKISKQVKLMKISN